MKDSSAPAEARQCSASNSELRPEALGTEIRPRIERLVDSLYHQGGAEKFGLTPEDFASILREVGAKYLPASPDEAEIAEFYASLHLEELVLARACARGHESAWEVFLNLYREKLYEAAGSMAKEESSARELADSLYADLFGMRQGDAGRISKLNSYTGRGSLEGWLRTVLAQEYVNRYRSQRRLVSLEEQIETGVQLRAREPDPPPVLDTRLEAATDEALLALSAEDKFILAAYYLDGRRLAEVARILGVHESTISRRVERMTHAIRKRILHGLMRRGMSRTEAEEALQADVRNFSLDVRARLMQEGGG